MGLNCFCQTEGEHLKRDYATEPADLRQLYRGQVSTPDGLPPEIVRALDNPDSDLCIARRRIIEVRDRIRLEIRRAQTALRTTPIDALDALALQAHVATVLHHRANVTVFLILYRALWRQMIEQAELVRLWSAVLTARRGVIAYVAEEREIDRAEAAAIAAAAEAAAAAEPEPEPTAS